MKILFCIHTVCFFSPHTSTHGSQILWKGGRREVDVVDDFDKKKKKTYCFQETTGQMHTMHTWIHSDVYSDNNSMHRPFQISARQNTRGEKYVCVWGGGVGDAHVI